MAANHPLRRWRETNNIESDDFCQRIGVDRSTLYSYELGRRKPRWAVLERIRKATDGEVMPNDFLPATVEAQSTEVGEGG